MTIPFLLSADIANIGRFNVAMLSDHDLMGVFLSPDDYEAAREQLGGDEDDACTWKGISCDEDLNITSIDWHSSRIAMEGEVNLRALPPKLTKLNAYRQKLSGEVDITALPEDIIIVCVQSTKIHGTLDMGSLPQKIEQFFFTGNRITSITNVCNFPVSLKFLHFGEHNIADKQIRIGQLPHNHLVLNFRGTPKDVQYVFEVAGDRQRFQGFE